MKVGRQRFFWLGAKGGGCELGWYAISKKLYASSHDDKEYKDI